jgi:SAM-dependent methyltransferase
MKVGAGDMESYSSHLLRYTNRPGEFIQKWLVRRTVNKFFCHSDKAPKNVLEIGTGIGRAARCVAERGINYVGIEPTDSLRLAAIDNLQEFASVVKIENLAFETLHNLPTKFDHTFAIHVIEHASSPNQARDWVAAMKNQTNVGGLISVACPNYLSYGKSFYDGDWTHAYPTTLNRLIALGEDLDLKVVYGEDTRATFSNPLIKIFLAVFGLALSTRLLNSLGHKVFNAKYLGTGIKIALFWRLSVVTFQRTN